MILLQIFSPNLNFSFTYTHTKILSKDNAKKYVKNSRALYNSEVQKTVISHLSASFINMKSGSSKKKVPFVQNSMPHEANKIR